MKYVFVIFLILLAFSVADARSLYVGVSGEDVRDLQEFLNSNPETQVAVSGPGSPGNETTYFGELTKAAVIKFQEIYKEEILEPLDLLVGTGFVGDLTRQVIDSLLNKIVSVEEVQTEIPVENEYYTNDNVFGGKIERSFYCACSRNYYIEISDPKGGDFVWDPTSPQFREHQLPEVGVWTVGLYEPGGICIVYSGDDCRVYRRTNNITEIVGTSF
ncbi:MAG: peptidoglycan-binding protein [Candidatus Pacebacteria bacterium]|nr:peptidoglycan-binding protein [Candidatus Paceibacterota bacterium]